MIRRTDRLCDVNHVRTIWITLSDIVINRELEHNYVGQCLFCDVIDLFKRLGLPRPFKKFHFVGQRTSLILFSIGLLTDSLILSTVLETKTLASVIILLINPLPESLIASLPNT